MCQKHKFLVKKNKHGHNFQNIASKTNQRWVITYDNPLIHFGTNILKIVAVLVFLTPHNFANGPHFVALIQLRATKKKILCSPFIYIFLILSA